MLMSPMDLSNPVSSEPSVATMRKTEGETTAEPVICTALYDYNAVEKDELSFSAGDEIVVLSPEEANLDDPGWRLGRRVGDPDKKVGMFPANFVTVGTVRDAVERQLSKPIIIKVEEVTFNDVIGAGGFGKVYRALWRGEEVAVKSARFEGPLDDDEENGPEKEVLREARLFSLLRHPNIVELFGVCLEAPNFCLVMELCRGGALSRLLEKTKLPANVVIDWAQQIAQGMLYLHNDLGTAIIHRDLKSSNVLLTNEVHTHDVCTMSGNTLKISDFGLARQSNRTTHMSVAGTYAWMSPEVIKKSTFSKASDVWSFGVVLWELLTGEVPYRGMDGMAVFYGVATGQHRLPIPSTCPEPLKDLMEACWAMDPKQRPLFEDIVMELNSIADSAFATTDNDSFLEMQKVWQEEIQALFRDLSEKEQELRTREDALQEEAVVHELQKADLKRREEELAKREFDLLQREITMITSTVVKNQEKHAPPAPNKRKSKNGLRGFISKLGGRSDSQPQISKPSAFQHTMSVQRSPSPDRRDISLSSSRQSSTSRSPPGSPDNHQTPAIRAITISNSLLRSAKSEMVLDPAGAVDAAVDEHLKSFTMDSSNDPTMRFKSQTLPRNTKYYCDSDSNSSQRTLVNQNSGGGGVSGSASTTALVTTNIEVEEIRASSGTPSAGVKIKRGALGSLAKLRSASPASRTHVRDIFSAPKKEEKERERERERRDSPTPKLSRTIVLDPVSCSSTPNDYLSPATDSGEDEGKLHKSRHSLPHLFSDSSSPTVKRSGGFRNPAAIVGMSPVQAGHNGESAVSPSTPGSCSPSPSISPAPTPSAIDNRSLRPQRHSTGMMSINSNASGGSPNTPPSLSTPSSHTSPLAGTSPSPCPSPTVLDASGKPQRSSIARPRPRAISTGNLRGGASSIPPPANRLHAASTAGAVQVTPAHSPAMQPFQAPQFTPSHLTPTPPILQ
eukprot:scpid27812/ scgid7580/ Mitogen-activated protein kinase kinase kinase 10